MCLNKLNMMENNILNKEVTSSSSSNVSSESSSDDLSFLNALDSSSTSSNGVADLFEFSSDEDEAENTAKRVRRDRVCIKNYCETVVQEYSDEEFILQFRLDRATVNQLISRYSRSKYCMNLNCKFCLSS